MSDEQATNTAPFKRCYKCGHKNRRGVIFCEVCGAQIGTGISGDSKRASQQLPILPEDDTMDTRSAPAPPRNITPQHVTRQHGNSDFYRETSQTEMLDQRSPPGSCVFREYMVLKLEGRGINEPILLRPFEEQPIILGRYDKEADYQPDVDLHPFGGHQQGISRRHAAITRSGRRLFIEDLGSSNGTHINNVMIDAGEPHQLRDSDEIRLGNLILRVTFKA